jgi:SAM-dependent methyltransferase
VHEAAHDYVAAAVAERGPFARVAEFGSLDINGSVRPLFGDARYVGVDRVPGTGVDVVADAATWVPDELFDCVVCCEVLEHLADWRGLMTAAHEVLAPGGTLIVTCAGPGRGPHSAVDGNALRPDEHYANVEAEHLAAELAERGFEQVEAEQHGLDTRATAVKPCST